MPNYKYKCKKCNHIFNEWHGINEKPEILCPECGEISEKAWGIGSFGIKGCPNTKI